MVKQDDNINGTHVRMLYDDMNNCIRTDLYFGNDLYFSDIYTFSTPASNPFITLAGIDFGFPFYGTAGLSNKQWFTSNRGVIYDNGTPTVLYNYDPSKTVMQTGDNNFPVTASYYDKITKHTDYYAFNYDNCNGISDKANSGNMQTPANMITNKTAGQIRPMLFKGSPKSIKEQIQKLKERYGNQVIK